MSSSYQTFRADRYLHTSLRLSFGALQLQEETDSNFGLGGVLFREGKKAKVYQCDRRGQKVALKVFFRKYAEPVNMLITQQLKALDGMPGLSVCRRDVIDSNEAAALGVTGLAYAIVMPWIDGRPWASFIEEEEFIPQASCISLARQTARVLAGLEQVDLVHADISSTNVIVPTLFPQPVVELIDVEDMYHPGFVDVTYHPDGSPGYQHPLNVRRGCWNAFGDRFAASILLTEMLTWHQPAIRAVRADASLFDQSELCQPGSKFTTVHQALTLHSPTAARLFQQAWTSTGLSTCPTLESWRSALEAATPSATPLAMRRFGPLQPHASLAEVLRNPRLQTSFLSAAKCNICGQLIKAGNPKDHAIWCTHHPTKFAPLFDLPKQAQQPGARTTDWDRLLKRFSTPEKPRTPQFDDVSFRPLVGDTTPTPPSPLFSQPFRRGGIPAWPPAPSFRYCLKCQRTVSVTGTTEKGHGLTCADGAIARFIKNL